MGALLYDETMALPDSSLIVNDQYGGDYLWWNPKTNLFEWSSSIGSSIAAGLILYEGQTLPDTGYKLAPGQIWSLAFVGDPLPSGAQSGDFVLEAFGNFNLYQLGETVATKVLIGTLKGDPGAAGENGDTTVAVGNGTASGTRAIPAGAPSTQRYPVSGTLTFTLANGVANKSYTVTIVLSMSAAQTINWPSNVLWPEGVKPAAPGAGRHIFNLLWDGGAWQGAYVGPNFA